MADWSPCTFQSLDRICPWVCKFNRKILSRLTCLPLQKFIHVADENISLRNTQKLCLTHQHLKMYIYINIKMHYMFRPSPSTPTPSCTAAASFCFILVEYFSHKILNQFYVFMWRTCMTSFICKEFENISYVPF
jgi:hypothetical protein